MCGTRFRPCDTDTGKRRKYCSAECLEAGTEALALRWPKAHRNHLPKYMRRWRDRNRTHLNAYARCRYAERDPEKHRAVQAHWREKHREEIQKHHSCWRAKNRAHVRDYARRYYHQHSNKILQRRRARKRARQAELKQRPPRR
jgi:hypothetical protein